MAKIITFLEINKTVAANRRPWGSIIKGSSMKKALVDKTFHSIKVVVVRVLAFINNISLRMLKTMRVLEELSAEIIIIVLRKF